MGEGETSLLWGCICPSLRGCMSPPPEQRTCCSCQGVPARRGSLQTSHSRVALLINPCLFRVSYRLGRNRAPQPGSVGAFARFGGSLQRSQNSRARAAQTAESRTMSSSSSSSRSRPDPAHLLANYSLHRSSRTLPGAPSPQQVRACSD